MQMAKLLDRIETKVTQPIPGTLSAVLSTPESVDIANKLLSEGDEWTLVSAIPVSLGYRCNVLNCGNGKCVHQVTDERCPHCSSRMVLVTSTGHRFCSNHEIYCDYEVEYAETRR